MANEAREVERRAQRRRPANALAWADPGGILPVIDCKILDLSDTGARVLTPAHIALPDRFQLQTDSSRILGAVEVVWRSDNIAGVKFVKPA